MLTNILLFEIMFRLMERSNISSKLFGSVDSKWQHVRCASEVYESICYFLGEDIVSYDVCARFSSSCYYI